MWWYNQGTDSVSVKTGAAANASADVAAAELATALGMEQRINRQNAELQHNGATIQSHEAEIQRLREQVQFLSTHQDRSFAGSDRLPSDPNKEKLYGANWANRSDTGFILDDSDENLERQLEVNARRTRQYRGRFWPSNIVAPERPDNNTGSHIIGGSPGVSSQDLGNSGNDDGHVNLPDGKLADDVGQQSPAGFEVRSTISQHYVQQNAALNLDGTAANNETRIDGYAMLEKRIQEKVNTVRTAILRERPQIDLHELNGRAKDIAER